MLRLHTAAVMAAIVLSTGCGPTRTIVVEQRPETGDLIPHVNAVAQARGLSPQTDGESTVKFFFDRETGTKMYFNVKRNGLVLAVRLDEEKVPDKAAQEDLYAKAEALGRDILAEAKTALERQREAEARAAEEQARREEEQRRRDAEAASQRGSTGPGLPPLKNPVEMPKMPGSNPSGAGQSQSSQVYCCVNKQYYDCPSAAAVDRCVGRYSRCVSGCGLSGDCMMKCLETDPPDPSMCRRDTSKDGQCSR